MGRSQRLRLDQIRAVFRLVREVCELGENASAWRRHALTELGRLIGAPRGFAMVYRGERARRFFSPADPPVLVGPDVFSAAAAYRDVSDNPIEHGLAQLIANVGNCFTCLRQSVCEDRTWYRTAFFNELLRPMGQDHFLVSEYDVTVAGYTTILSFAREIGDPPFTDIERQIVHLFHEELAQVWQTPSLTCGPRLERPLSPRVNQTLRLLAAGDNEKQIALRLGLSRHTVHGYVKDLHRRFGAGNLGELLARARPAPRFRPRLADAEDGTPAYARSADAIPE